MRSRPSCVAAVDDPQPSRLRTLDRPGRVGRRASRSGRAIIRWRSGTAIWRRTPPLKQAELAFRARTSGSDAEAARAALLPDAFAWIRARSRSRGSRSWRARLFYTIVPVGPSYAVHSTGYFAASVVVVPAGPAAARRSARGDVARGGAAPPVALWLWRRPTVVAGLVFFPQERFRIPVIDPALIVTRRLAGAALGDT